MSSSHRPVHSGSRFSVASRTAFDALTVEGLDSEGEESEEVVVEADDSQLQSQKDNATTASLLDTEYAINISIRYFIHRYYSAVSNASLPRTEELTEPAKPSKAAMKRAAKAARQNVKSQNGSNSLNSVTANAVAENLPEKTENTVVTSTDDCSIKEKPIEDFKIINNDNTINITPTSHSPPQLASTKTFVPEPNGISHDKQQSFNSNPPIPNYYDVYAPPAIKTDHVDFDKIEKERAPKESQPQQGSKKIQNVLTRTLWTFIMIAVFLCKFHYILRTIVN